MFVIRLYFTQTTQITIIITGSAVNGSSMQHTE